MNNKDFDFIIKDQLSALEASHNKASWEMMKAHMADHASESIDLSDEELDNIVKRTIDSYDVPFNPNHQDKFIHQYYNYVQYKRKKIYHFVSRAVIILLLMFSSAHMYQSFYYNSSSELEYTTYYNSQIDLIAYQKEVPNHQSKIKVSDNYTLALTNDDSNITESYLNKPIHANTVVGTEPNVHFPIVNSKTTSEQFVDPNTTNHIDKASMVELKMNRKLFNTPLEIINAGVSTTNKMIDLSNKVAILPTFIGLEKNKTSVGVWGSYDRNKNYTPNKDNFNGGYSFGINYSERISKFEIETGLAYSHQIFSPDHNSTLYGSSNNLKSINVKQVNRKVISIPIQLKYHIPNQNSWNYYATIGAKYNTVLINDNREIVESSAGLREDLGQNISRVRPEDRGILQGGNILDNSYVSTTFGFGIQQQINNHLSFYVEPNFQVQLYPDAIGFSNDGLKSLNIKLGIKANI